MFSEMCQLATHEPKNQKTELVYFLQQSLSMDLTTDGEGKEDTLSYQVCYW